MNKLLIPVLSLALISGCVSLDQQATLTTNYKNKSNSIQDLEKNIQPISQKQVYDQEKDMNIYFQYIPDTEDIQNISVHKNTSSDTKHVINYQFADSKITEAKLEIHQTTPNGINLSNHSFHIKDNKVTNCMYNNSQELPPTDPKVRQQVQDLETEIDYINQTYL